MQSPQDPTRDPPLVHSESQGQRSETSKQEVEGFHLQLCSQQQRQSRLPHIWSEREASDAHLWALRSCHVAAGRRPLVVCAYVCVCWAVCFPFRNLFAEVSRLSWVCLSEHDDHIKVRPQHRWHHPNPRGRCRRVFVFFFLHFALSLAPSLLSASERRPNRCVPLVSVQVSQSANLQVM